MRIAVIDGQGGGIGSGVIGQLRAAALPAEIIAVGTNVSATAAMLKAGADAGATGENAVVYNASRCDAILGPIGIVLADAMLGEITPAMARAVASSDARKILIPAAKCSVRIAGVENKPTTAYIAEAVALLREEFFDKAGGNASR